MFVKILLIYAAANIELRNWKYLQRVGENLIFLLSSLYLIVGFSRHIELYNLHYFSHLVPYISGNDVIVYIKTSSDILRNNTFKQGEGLFLLS